MTRDIDFLLRALRHVLPRVAVEQLRVAHPGADDDGLWYVRLPEDAADVQVESNTGAAPFLIEADGWPPVTAPSLEAALPLVLERLGHHAGSPAAGAGALPMEHPARITWSAAQVARGLPPMTRTVDPTWQRDDVPGHAEAWSLVCRFPEPPVVQGNPSLAWVHPLMSGAPAAWLRPGSRLWLFERATQQYATVDILD